LDRTTVRTTARLEQGERIVAVAPVWSAPLRPRVPVLFLQRRRRVAALTDRRLLVFAWRGRGDDRPLLARSLVDLEVVRTKRWRPLSQLRLRTEDHRELLLELRPRDRRFGRRVHDAITSRPRTAADPDDARRDVVSAPEGASVPEDDGAPR
jgi:hypothetical protein